MMENGFVHACWQTARDGFDDCTKAQTAGEAAKGALFAIGGATGAAGGAILSGVGKAACTTLRGAEWSVSALVDRAVETGHLDPKYRTALKVIGRGVIGTLLTVTIGSAISDTVSSSDPQMLPPPRL